MAVQIDINLVMQKMSMQIAELVSQNTILQIENEILRTRGREGESVQGERNIHKVVGDE